MRHEIQGVLLLIGILVSLTASADDKAALDHGYASTETSIPFATSGGITDWQVEDDATLLLQDRHGRWYRVRLLAPARELAFAHSLGIATAPSGTLERLDAIIIKGKRYPILSLTPLPATKKPELPQSTPTIDHEPIHPDNQR